MTGDQFDMFLPDVLAHPPVTEEEIDFDSEESVVPVRLEPHEPQGRAVSIAGGGHDEQRADRVPERRIQSGDGPQGAEAAAGTETIAAEVQQKKNGEPEQIALLNIPEWWEEHWKGMPEFEQKDFMPYKTIYVHFECKADMEKFAQLVGQNVTVTTKSLWYPEAEMDEVSKLRWIASPECDNGKKEELKEILDGG